MRIYFSGGPADDRVVWREGLLSPPERIEMDGVWYELVEVFSGAREFAPDRWAITGDALYAVATKGG